MSLTFEYLEETFDVYDITVSDNHNFFANDILVHNCTEIELPTIELKQVDDPAALISLCTLTNTNWGNIKKPSDLQKRCRLAVFALDALLDYQDYPLQAARNSTLWYRSLGIGINDFAHFLANHDVKYGTPECLQLVDEYAEAQMFYLLEASVELAELYGPCGKYEHTKYSQGLVPMDVRKLSVDELLPHTTRMPWGPLRARMAQFGVRNATLAAQPPSETSSKLHNLTNGFEAPRGIVVSKDGSYIVVPEADRLRNKYQLAWNVDVEDYLKTAAILQKHMDQGISVNTTYDPSKYPDNKIPGTLIFRHLLLGYKWGIKAFYYNNGVKNTHEAAPVEESGTDCDNCKL